MAIIKSINSKSSIGKAIKYITQEEKTENLLTYGKDCRVNVAIEQMKATKNQFNKAGGREYVHLVQSFNPKDNISFQKAHELGIEFIEKCEKYKDHEIIMATHKDKEHIHNHFIINSVNFNNGSKLSTSAKELEQIKQISNNISKENNLTVPQKATINGQMRCYDSNKYRTIEKGLKWQSESYMLDMYKKIRVAKKRATSKEHLSLILERYGIKITRDTKKDMTFKNSDNKKVRLSNFQKTFNDIFLDKEVFESSLRINKKDLDEKIKEQARKKEEIEKSKRKNKSFDMGLER